MKDVIVIGGGISGLTAAINLMKQPNRPFRVTLLEAEDVVGGQARAFIVDGETVEHGSHAFFGYYQTILNFIEELRSDPNIGPDMPALEQVIGWTLVDPYGRQAHLVQSKWLPLIASVVPSFLKVPWFNFCDKVRGLWAALRLMMTPFSQYKQLDQYTSFNYGKKVGYTDLGILTWNLASLGLTNLFVQEQSAAILAGKHHLLMGTRGGLDYKLPAGNLSRLIAEPARKKLLALGGTILTGATATSATRASGSNKTIVKYQTAKGEQTIEGDYVIVALQPWDAKKLLPWMQGRWNTLNPVTPVITTVLQLSGRIAASADSREYGLSRENWTFSVVTDLSRFWPEFKGDKTVLRCEVGHANLLPKGVDTPDDILQVMIKRDIDRLFPEAANMTVEWFDAHRESKALYVSWVKGEFQKKPEPAERDLGQGCFLAGDWTSKGTIGMEAACNSGIEAANHVLVAEKLPPIQYQDVPLD